LQGGKPMRKILMTGLITCFLIGLVFFFLKFLIVDILAPVFSPLILFLFGKAYLVIPLSVVFTFIIIIGVGAASTRIRFQDFINRYVIRGIPKDLERGRGALVEFNPGTSFLAIIIKEVDLKRANGEMQRYYVLYCPSVPLPWTGLPMVFVEKQKVIPLRLSYGELYSIIGSFGTNVPATLAELKTQGLL
jgi:uncharacterized membrane protein